eukprot:scaffold23175_cov115-Isochrysis_galbana.AAC.8
MWHTLPCRPRCRYCPTEPAARAAACCRVNSSEHGRQRVHRYPHKTPHHRSSPKSPETRCVALVVVAIAPSPPLRPPRRSCAEQPQDPLRQKPREHTQSLQVSRLARSLLRLRIEAGHGPGSARLC